MAEFKRSQLDTAVERLREKLANADLRRAARQLERELSGYGVPDAAALVTAARQRLESELGKVRPKYSLKRDGRQDWYAGPGDDGIWLLLQQYLLAPHGKGWPESDVQSIDDSSTDVVAQLDPPNQDGFSNRGVVLGCWSAPAFGQSGTCPGVCGGMATVFRGHRGRQYGMHPPQCDIEPFGCACCGKS